MGRPPRPGARVLGHELHGLPVRSDPRALRPSARSYTHDACDGVVDSHVVGRKDLNRTADSIGRIRRPAADTRCGRCAVTSSGSRTDSAPMPRASASTMTCTARISLRAPDRRTTAAVPRRVARLAGWSWLSRSTFSPSLTAQMRRMPALASAASAPSQRRSSGTFGSSAGPRTGGGLWAALKTCVQRGSRQHVRQMAIGKQEDASQRPARLGVTAQSLQQQPSGVFGHAGVAGIAGVERG